MRKPLSYIVALGIGAALGAGTISYAAPGASSAPTLAARVAALERQVNKSPQIGVGSIADARRVVRDWCVWLRHSDAVNQREIGDPVPGLLRNWKLSCGPFRG